jgi:P27 family predicted phage terminase small subunit
MPTPRNRPELKLLLGVEPRKRETSAPSPAVREPEPLTWFTVRQRQIWDEVTGELREMGTLSAADRYSIATYCAVVAHLETAVTELNADPSYAIDTRYSVTVNPVLLAVDRLALRLNMAARALGLSPAARSLMYGRSQVKDNVEAEAVRDLYA